VKIVLVGKQMGSIGGIQAVNRSLREAFVGQGFPCEVFSFRDQQAHGLLGRLHTLVTDLRRFLSVLREEPSVYVFNVSGAEVLLYSLLCKLYRKDFYYWLHGNPLFLQGSFSGRLMKRIFFRFARAVVVLHSRFGEMLIGSGRVVAIPNVVPQLEKYYSAGATLRRVVWVGRNSPEKGPNTALAAMSRLAGRFPNVDFVIVSPEAQVRGQEQENLRFVDGREFQPKAFFDATSLHLLTSTMEAMPGVLFESTSCGSFFMATRCSPWVQDIETLGHGLGVPVGIGPTELAEELARVLSKNHLKFDGSRVGEYLAAYNGARVIDRWLALLGLEKQ
jgi:glycosyltransferase involved in cell wall biosynthesis